LALVRNPPLHSGLRIFSQRSSGLLALCSRGLLFQGIASLATRRVVARWTVTGLATCTQIASPSGPHPPIGSAGPRSSAVTGMIRPSLMKAARQSLTHPARSDLVYPSSQPRPLPQPRLLRSGCRKPLALGWVAHPRPLRSGGSLILMMSPRFRSQIFLQAQAPSLSWTSGHLEA